MTRPSLRRLAGIASAAILATGCAHRSKAADQAPPEEAEFVLNIVNHHWQDVRIYVIGSGQPLRVGTVTAVTEHSFTLPSWILGPSRVIRIYANAIGGNDYFQTDVISVQPGQYIELRLETDLSRSTYGVY
ncbi:MAG TPA: hypothetical protein VMH88_04305 [Gemmatimonadales bacterium]|nr:hypothetical protein [Gemmatimonadales bacterium]